MAAKPKSQMLSRKIEELNECSDAIDRLQKEEKELRTKINDDKEMKDADFEMLTGVTAALKKLKEEKKRLLLAL
jgi:hypothetical protein